MSRMPYTPYTAQNLIPTGPSSAEELAYRNATAMGFPMLLPPHVLAPTVMNPPPQVVYYPMPTLPPLPAAVQIPQAIQQYLPKKATPAVAPTPPVAPVIVPLNQIANGIESSSPEMQQTALQGLQKLLVANPDFKKPTSGSVPEAILLKALKSPNELFVGQILSSMGGDIQGTTPRLRSQLRKLANNTQFFPPTRDIAKKLASGQTNFMPAGTLEAIQAVAPNTLAPSDQNNPFNADLSTTLSNPSTKGINNNMLLDALNGGLPA